jgi:hypothetical protein
MQSQLPVSTGLRRQKLVMDVFRHVKEIQCIDDGYAFRFYYSDDLGDLDELIVKIADYMDHILFENRDSPQLEFTIVQEPWAEEFWLHVRSLEGEKHNVTWA